MNQLPECEKQDIEGVIGNLEVNVLEVDVIDDLPQVLQNTTFKQVELPLGGETIMDFELPSDLPDFYAAIKYSNSDDFVFVEETGGALRVFGPDDSIIDDLRNREVDQVIFLVSDSENVTRFEENLSTELVIKICGELIHFTQHQLVVRNHCERYRNIILIMFNFKFVNCICITT